MTAYTKEIGLTKANPAWKGFYPQNYELSNMLWGSLRSQFMNNYSFFH